MQTDKNRQYALDVHGDDKMLWPVVGRALRGRRLLALSVSLAACLGGAMILYFTISPNYRSTGVIRLASDQQSVFRTEGASTAVTAIGFIASQVEDIVRGEVIDLTLEDPWMRQALGGEAGSFQKLRGGLEAENRLASPLIKISYICENDLLAQRVVDRVIGSYITLRMKRHAQNVARQVTVLSQRREALKNQRESLRGMILAIKNNVTHGSVRDLYARYEKRVERLDGELSSLKIQFAGAESIVQGLAEKEKHKLGLQGKINAATLADGDVVLNQYLDELTKLEISLSRLKDKFTNLHPEVIAGTKQIKQLQKKIDQRIKRHYAAGKPKAEDGHELSWGQQAMSLQMQLTKAQLLRDEANEKYQALGKKIREQTPQAKLDQAQYQSEHQQVNARILALNTRIAHLELEKNQQSFVEIVSGGSLPSKPLANGRLGKAVIGGLLGLLLGFAGIVLLGIRDKRCFYPDQASYQLGDVPVLGIVPKLHLKSSKPREMGLAAYCIGGIRSNLEFGGLGQSKKTVMLTSAGEGEGKSDLAFAVAMSFAGSGSRTLLIDFDLDSFALSNRVGSLKESGLGILPVNGLRQAINGVSLHQAVDGTDIPNLSVLMAGKDDRPTSSMLSVNAVKHILCQAEEQYDVIIVDGGQLPYGRSSSVVASQVDGAVLVVSRKQKYPLLQRSVTCLEQLGTPVAGIVFNYAKLNQVQSKKASDFVGLENLWDGKKHTSSEPLMGSLAMAVAVNLMHDLGRFPGEATSGLDAVAA